MSIILDLIIVAIVLFFVITSAKRGFVKTVLDVVAFFLALYISVSFSGVLAEGIYNIFIKDAVVKSVEKSMPELPSNLENIDKAFETMPKFVQNAAEKYGVSNDQLSEFLKNSKNDEEIYENIVDSTAKPMIVNIVKSILYILLFIVLCIVFKFVVRIINKFIE